MLSILTLIGVWIFNRFAPRMGKSNKGAINKMSQDAVTKIATD